MISSCDAIADVEDIGKGGLTVEGAGERGLKARGRMDMSDIGFTFGARERGLDGAGTFTRWRMEDDDVCFPMVFEVDEDVKVVNGEGAAEEEEDVEGVGVGMGRGEREERGAVGVGAGETIGVTDSTRGITEAFSSSKGRCEIDESAARLQYCPIWIISFSLSK